MFLSHHCPVRTILRPPQPQTDPAHQLTDFAKKQSVDLIVIGTHGRTGLFRALMGSVAESVVRHATCPVITVKHPKHKPAGEK